MNSPVRLVAALMAALALLASACGGGSSTETSADSEAAAGDHDVIAIAEANIDGLASNEDVRLLEVLDLETGEPTTLSDTVTGDRPVLVWFWAPH